MTKPYILTIAGFDPSGCAGILADCKTIETLGGYAMAVCTANTFQNDVEFEAVNWIPEEQIMAQYSVLQRRFTFDVVKIGLVPSLTTLSQLVNTLVNDNPKVKIIWDPVLKASAGFEFHSDISIPAMEDILKKIYLITPNIEEAQKMVPGGELDAIGRALAEYCPALIKGGHATDKGCTDKLFMGKGTFRFETPRIPGEGKRGTGCVLSSAIAAHTAFGEALPNACKKAKTYVTRFINSGVGVVGYHEKVDQ